jgi:hypothetical protein
MAKRRAKKSVGLGLSPAQHNEGMDMESMYAREGFVEIRRKLRAPNPDCTDLLWRYDNAVMSVGAAQAHDVSADSERRRNPSYYAKRADEAHKKAQQAFLRKCIIKR